MSRATSEDVVSVVGVSPAVGAGWFRQGEGTPAFTIADPGGIYLTFEEREEIALLHGHHKGVCEIAPEPGHDLGTISCELRRNVATRDRRLNIVLRSRSGKSS